MNAGHSAEELGISRERRDLIAALEEAGFDGAPNTPPDWRTSLGDETLRSALAVHESWPIPTFLAAIADPEPEMPELDELFEAARAAVAAGNAYAAACPDDAVGAGPEWDAWDASFTRLRDIVARADRALATAFPETGVPGR